MKVGIYKEVHIDTSHRLLHYIGKCANLHGHRWKIEVWIEGESTILANAPTSMDTDGRLRFGLRENQTRQRKS